MAPELIAEKGCGKMIDWWALGVTLFEMVTGNVPHS